MICCRSSPKQKSEVVSFVKNQIKSITLGIGDGGNDVEMIQTAHIGVGILGKEGSQAATSAEYSITRFKFLGRLLLVHGRWCHVRISLFILVFFYKNMVFTLQQLWFSIYSGFSAQTFFDEGYLLNFNSIITASAPGYIGAFEIDVSPEDGEHVVEALPSLFKANRENPIFTYKIFFIWFAVGIVESVGIFYFVKACVGITASVESGQTDGLWMISITNYSCIIGHLFVTFALIIRRWNRFTHFCFWGLTMILYFPLFMVAWDQFQSPVEGMFLDLMINNSFWLTTIGVIGISLLLKYTYRLIIRLFYPKPIDELIYITKTKEMLKAASKKWKPQPSVELKQALDELRQQITEQNTLIN